MKEKEPMVVEGRGAVRGGSFYSSLCFCICLKFFTVKS